MPEYLQFAAGALVVLALFFLVYKLGAKGKIGAAGTALAHDFRVAETTIRAEAMKSLTHAEAWLTDTAEEDALILKAEAMKAQALASKASKALMAQAHIAKLSSLLPTQPSV